MSAASSPMAPSPQPDVPRAPRVCIRCKAKKKKCDKALPRCGRCVESLHECSYEEEDVVSIYSPHGGPVSPVAVRHGSQSLGPVSFVGSIQSAVSIHHLAFQSMREIVGDRPRIEQVVLSYFAVAYTWMTIIDWTIFERQLESNWQIPSAETCIVVICMSLMARLSAPTLNFQVIDAHYHSAKALLSLVHSSGLTLTTASIQAELLIAQYEYSNALPQQAYFSVGRCYQISRASGWHSKLFWEESRRQNFSSELKLASTLWWAIVQIDNFISVEYADRKYPMHTADLNLGFEIPLPKDFDQYLPVAFLGRPFADGPMFDIDGMALHEATSSWCLSNTMQQLYHPTPSDNREQLSGAILNHAAGLGSVPGSGPWISGDNSGAMATSLIALMKLNSPGLAGMAPSVPGSTSSAEKVRFAIDYIHSVVNHVDQYRNLLRLGKVAPTWAYAMMYAALLLIRHGNDVLGDVAWLPKVENLRKLLELQAGRWRIARNYVEQINMALSSRLVPYAL
ncbi:hypothetical protein QBC38DRAFT_454107 [Podospora fimiseda]|uniref:Zn(2)-C6 fungal-type domain-containing protein n=1 Tax=Podospora fimiseda TaxID=252190 RepID=A0AAN7BS20_9PEZI|nr:hypothetical protein QBC38DRAFT_454107 [Podospora fimiseda]